MTEERVPVEAVIRRLRREPFCCSTRDILDMSPVMIKQLLCSSDDDDDRRMGRGMVIPPGV